jgi:hypothetical protein
MNRTLKTRLVTLEAARVGGCPTCRTWSGMVLRDDDGNRSRPECCPECGRLVPIWHELHLVGIPLDCV